MVEVLGERSESLASKDDASERWPFVVLELGYMINLL